jgi:hypothetical protein
MYDLPTGGNPKPTIKPSRLEPAKKEKPKGGSKKRPGSEKRHKTAELVIDQEIKVPPVQIPEGSRFKGYRDFIVQDLRISSHNVDYLLECWKTPEGGYLRNWEANTSERGLFALYYTSITTAM